MPRLSWNEIRDRAAVFAARWRSRATHLMSVHEALDRLYRKKPFPSDQERLELLFERYRELVEQAR